MPQVIIAAGAARGLDRCRRFLADKNPEAAKRAAHEIARHFRLLQSSPAIGRPLAEHPELRELLIGFGESGYAALYHHDPEGDAVVVLAFRHQKEAGY